MKTRVIKPLKRLKRDNLAGPQRERSLLREEHIEALVGVDAATKGAGDEVPTPGATTMTLM
jgi:hypothetical protein